MHHNPLNDLPGGGGPAPAPTYQAPGAQPAYGHAPNAYAPPAHATYQPGIAYEEEGSYGLGFAVGFIFSLIGYIIVAIAGKPETKRGAGHGLITTIIVGVGLRVLLLMMV